MRNIVKKGTLAVALVSALSFSLAGCGTSTSTTKAAAPKTSSTKTTATTTAAKAPTANQYLVIEPGGKLGPDGKMHDAYINGDIKITEGQPVTLHFLNYDTGNHTYTNSDLGLNVEIKGTAKDGTPQETDYTFTPTKTGTFKWQCMDKCDGGMTSFGMTNTGYMQGTITVLPSSNKVQYVSTVINPGYKLGTDGKLHDAYTPTDITVNAGSQVQLSVYNFDDGTHTLTANDIGVNMQVKGATTKGTPTVTTYTFTPTKKGTFKWVCMDQCDGGMTSYGMTHDGFMNGHIIVQ
jgi:plastocyanin